MKQPAVIRQRDNTFRGIALPPIFVDRSRQGAAEMERVTESIARGLKAARVAYSALTRLLHPTGLHVKERPAEAIRRVAHGESVTWMGFAIQVVASDLRCTVTDDGWPV